MIYRKHMIKLDALRLYSPIFLAAFLIGCGAIMEKESSDDKKKASDKKNNSSALACGESSHDNAAEEFRILNLGQAIKHFQHVWGPGSVKSVSTGGNIFEEYSASFPSTEGTEFSQTVADRMGINNPNSGLAMAYAIIGHNIGLIAAQADSNNEYFQCETEKDTAEMLNRAYPYRLSCANEGDPLVEAVTSMCKKSKQNAIAAVASSVSFYLRN